MLLQVNHLAKHYRVKKGETLHAVKSVNFQLESGKITAFLGPNGAGKTTTIKMIAGLIQPNGGDIFVDGQSMISSRRHALKKVGAVLEGSRNLYWRLTPLENFEYWGGLKGIPRGTARKRGRELMSLFGLESKLHSTLQQLSRGQQQQAAICTALIHSPSLLLLDEPTLGLDLAASDRIQTLIKELAREQNVGILLTTHQMEVAEELSDHVSIINKGELIMQGNKEEVLAQFSGDTYIFELDAPLPGEKRALLTENGADFTNESTFKMVLPNPEAAYDVIRQLEPCPIVRAQRDKADLASVFRHYTNGNHEDLSKERRAQ